MDEHIGIFVAWPYANGDLHLGHIAGAYLPADIFARFHRLRGNHVLMVSGSDAHGTPVTLQAEAQGIAPRLYFERYHRRFLDDWLRLGISFDLFTHTDTQNHTTVAQDMFRVLYDKGLISSGVMTQLYCESDRRFLPDRYVEGTCPQCGYASARGDQCDQCGRTLDAVDLLNPRCRICGDPPVPCEATHFFLDLPMLQERVLAYIEAQNHWRPTVRNFALHYVREGLRPRAVSRDLSWGIPLPISGYEGKVMYVWFEAVIGYLSASMEHAQRHGEPAAWEAWWRGPDARGYYFIGKDNIPFHSVIWPAELMGYDPTLLLPYDIPANEFLNLEGAQFSTSRDWAVRLPDYLERYAPDPLRYYLTSIAPETGDSEFTWQGFVEHNNNEVLATWGNLVQRVISFAYSRWDEQVPTPGPLDERDTALLDRIAAGFDQVGDLYARTKFKAALQETMGLARTVNRYLDEKAPWFQIKTDREKAATTIFVALRAIDSLKILFAPVLPFTSEEVQCLLGYDQPLFGRSTIETVAETTRTHEALAYYPVPEEGTVDRWRPSVLAPGQRLECPSTLFEKLDDGIVVQEQERLRRAAEA
jgi:methionyl-tRNA synthetase